MKNFTKILLLLLFFSFGSFTFAAPCADTITSGGVVVDVVTGNPCPDQNNNSGNSIQLTNPLGDTKDIPTLVQKILEIALKIGVPLIALAIIYTGYLFIAAQGRPEKLTEAKKALVWVVVGAAILLGAYVIAQALVGTIDAIRGN